MANTSDKQPKTANATSGTAEAQTSEAQLGQTQTFFVPEYNVSVEATSIEDAVAQAKKLKGVK